MLFHGSVTSLSPNVFSNLNQNPTQKSYHVMQYLDNEYTNNESGKKRYLMVKLSNGRFYALFMIHPSLEEKFLTQVIPLSIINVEICKRKEPVMLFVIFKWEIIYHKIEKIVGQPIALDSKENNFEANHEISEIIGKTNALNNKKDEDIQNSKQLWKEVGFINDGSNQMPFDASLNSQHEFRDKIEFDLNFENRIPVSSFSLIKSLTTSDKLVKIRGRIIFKDELTDFARKNGSRGRVFHIIILDTSGQIQGTFFDKAAVELCNKIELGKLYSFSSFDVKPRDKFTRADCKYQLIFDVSPSILKLVDEKDIATSPHLYSTIEEVHGKLSGDFVSIIGFNGGYSELKEVTLKNGTTKLKRLMLVYDETGNIEVEFWGKEAEEIKLEPWQMIICENVQVGEYQKIFLSFRNGSRMVVQIPDHHRLKELSLFLKQNLASLPEYSDLKNVQKGEIAQKMDDFHRIKEIIKIGIEMQDNTTNPRVFVNILASVTNFTGQFVYEACPFETCRTRATEPGVGTNYKCFKCGRAFITPLIEYACEVSITDDTGVLSLFTIGKDQCEVLLEIKPADLKLLMQNSPESWHETLYTNLYEEFIFRVMICKGKENESRFKCVKVTKFDKLMSRYFNFVKKTLELFETI